MMASAADRGMMEPGSCSPVSETVVPHITSRECVENALFWPGSLAQACNLSCSVKTWRVQFSRGGEAKGSALLGSRNLEGKP